MRAYADAKRAGADEAVFAEHPRRAVRGDGIQRVRRRPRRRAHTRRPSSGCLLGVTARPGARARAGPRAPGRRDRGAARRPSTTADEAFLTSTTREVQPIAASTGGRGRAAPGPVTTRLASRYADLVTRDLDPESPPDRVPAPRSAQVGCRSRPLPVGCAEQQSSSPSRSRSRWPPGRRRCRRRERPVPEGPRDRADLPRGWTARPADTAGDDATAKDIAACVGQAGREEEGARQRRRHRPTRSGNFMAASSVAVYASPALARRSSSWSTGARSTAPAPRSTSRPRRSAARVARCRRRSRSRKVELDAVRRPPVGYGRRPTSRAPTAPRLTSRASRPPCSAAGRSPATSSTARAARSTRRRARPARRRSTSASPRRRL